MGKIASLTFRQGPMTMELRYHMGRLRLAVAGIGSVAILVTAPLSSRSAEPATSGLTSTGMSVSGDALLKDGQPFRVHGFNMIGALTPQWCSNRAGTTARDHYGSAELSALVNTWHTNTVRFQVSQEGLGDTAAHTSTQISEYLSEIENDVAQARSYGLVVILSMQDQSIGCGEIHQLPNATTVQAWDTLAPAFKDDPYVMFELFNEPQNNYTSSAQWAQWRDGGTSPLCNAGITSTCSTAVGEQNLIDDIRGLGVDNLLLADGGNYAERFTGVGPYLLSDTSYGDGVGYAVHPYSFAPSSSFSSDETYYENAYGFLVDSGQLAVATEWNYQAGQCSGDDPTIAPQFLNWLENKGIGLTAMAGDYPGRTISDWNWDPTDCTTSVGGNGAQTQSWFTHLASAPSAPAALHATSTSSSITVSWKAPSCTFPLAGYDVSLNGVYETTTSQLSTTLAGLAPATTYTVSVSARDIMGNVSSASTTTVATKNYLP